MPLIQDIQASLGASAYPAFEAAQTAADRLALLRTLTWAGSGRYELPAHIQLRDNEHTLLARFALHLSHDQRVLSLNPEPLDEEVPGAAQWLHADRNSRRTYETAAADAPLLRFSNHTAYRTPTQKAALAALLTMPGKGALMVSMPTGSGKSLLFQLAVRYWRRFVPGACAIVITPTIALAQDHERSLRAITGLERCRALTGDVKGQEREDILFAFRRGEIPLLILSPETALGSAASTVIEAAKPGADKAQLGARLFAVFVDEAHIVESWGRSFRPDFQRLPALVSELRTHNPDLRTVLLSATLDEAARTVLRQAYGRDLWLEVHAGAPRYEFDLSVRRFTDPSERNRILLNLIDRAPRPAIVYTTRVEQAETLLANLRARGYQRVAAFSGATGPAERERILNQWMNNDLDLVVATSAFGLGVDKPNVRAVIHACLPENAARYYQEVGRASRDGLQGYGACLWTSPQRKSGVDSDEEDARGIALSSWLSPELAQARWSALVESAAWSWRGPVQHARLKLDAAREGLPRHTGQPNRVWNMSLLNLLQRAGVLRISDVGAGADDVPTWDVDILDLRLLGEEDQQTSVWSEVIAQRLTEQGAARSEFERFRDLMSGKGTDCLLRGVYQLIEPDAGDLPRCGRCASCRHARARPPEQIKLGGLDEVWDQSVAYRGKLPGAISLLNPRDAHFETGVEELLRALAEAGVEQFVVPDGAGQNAAAVLNAERCRFGFVHEFSDWIDLDRRFPGVATAVFADEHNTPRIQAWFEQAQNFTARFTELPLVLIARSDLTIQGRLLSAIASPLPPYPESMLAHFALDPGEPS